MKYIVKGVRKDLPPGTYSCDIVKEESGWRHGEPELVITAQLREDLGSDESRLQIVVPEGWSPEA